MTDLGTFTPLRLLCLKHGMSRKLLAERAGVTLRTIYNVEAGMALADETLFKIAAALGEEPVYVAGVLTGEIKLAFEVKAAA